MVQGWFIEINPIRFFVFPFPVLQYAQTDCFTAVQRHKNVVKYTKAGITKLPALFFPRNSSFFSVHGRHKYRSSVPDNGKKQ